MALAKVCGIETEYGVIVPGQPEFNPMTSSSILVTTYGLHVQAQLGAVGKTLHVGWDFEDESPAADARDEGYSIASVVPTVERHLANTVLPNGSRFYVDHAHPELSTPECRTPFEALLYDLAGEQILRESMRLSATDPGGRTVVVYKNNSDGKGQSYGCHENYLVDRSVPFASLAKAATSHFVSRQIFCGAGKVGSEATMHADLSRVPFQLSQRADFFEEPVGLETTIKRPIVNTRDEPHCDAAKYRRLHVIVGDANMSQWATLMKLATSALWFAALEDGFGLPDDWALSDPVRAIHAVSADPSLSTTMTLVNGSTLSALDLQREILRRCTDWADQCGTDAVDSQRGKWYLEEWGRALDLLECQPEDLADRVDWIAKRRILDGLTERHQLRPDDPRLRAVDLQYHDLRPEKSLAARAGLVTFVDAAQVTTAQWEPPESTRAYFRGRCLTKFAEDVVVANWDSMVFDTGEQNLRRIPMMDPLRGTKALVGDLIDRAHTARELIDSISA